MRITKTTSSKSAWRNRTASFSSARFCIQRMAGILQVLSLQMCTIRRFEEFQTAIWQSKNLIIHTQASGLPTLFQNHFYRDFLRSKQSICTTIIMVSPILGLRLFFTFKRMVKLVITISHAFSGLRRPGHWWNHQQSIHTRGHHTYAGGSSCGW